MLHIFCGSLEPLQSSSRRDNLITEELANVPKDAMILQYRIDKIFYLLTNESQEYLLEDEENQHDKAHDNKNGSTHHHPSFLLCSLSLHSARNRNSEHDREGEGERKKDNSGERGYCRPELLRK